jgi:hypothetical protein
MIVKPCYFRFMPMSPHLARSALVALTLYGGTAEVQALSISQMSTLELMVEDLSSPDGMLLMGPVGAYLQSLQKAGHRCELSTYEYGGLIDCQTRAEKRVLIDLVAEPTHGPEFARATVRPNGVNSKELASSEITPFLASLIAGPSAPGADSP